MILKNTIFPVGQIVKIHGMKGELAFSTNSSILQDQDIPSIFLEPQGLLVPFYIENVQMKSGSSGLIKLERVDSEEHAREYVGQTIYLPNTYLDTTRNEAFESEYFVGFEIVDNKKGNIGKVSAVDQRTANTLFIVKNNTVEILIPVVDEFITDIDHTLKIIRVTLPEGLLDL
ncbi:MAG: ribosome maturation factor RimM [Paludibacteraceae bacterium]